MDTNQSLSVSVGGVRLDRFLADAVPSVSRSRWQTLLRDGWVRVDGAPARANQRTKVGAVVTWALPAAASAEPAAEDIPLVILYEDDAVLVCDKPAGLVVHPAAGNADGTLLNALLFHDPGLARLDRAGLVHRLDKDTSGVLVVARTSAAQAELQRQFKARETTKEYVAIVQGVPPLEGRIENQLGRHPVQRKKMAVLEEGGRRAVSNYRVEEDFGHAALVRVRIETGRTHQIRVHLAHLGFPVVGDAVYGGRRRGGAVAPRQMLHAQRLAFTHPCNGKKLSFTAPLPDDMQSLLAELRRCHDD